MHYAAQLRVAKFMLAYLESDSRSSEGWGEAQGRGARCILMLATPTGTLLSVSGICILVPIMFSTFLVEADFQGRLYWSLLPGQ